MIFSETHSYKASFGNIYKHLSFWNQGFAIGSKALTKKQSTTNCFVAGPTGSGKSSGITLPCLASLIKGGSSIIFNDVALEGLCKVDYLQSKGIPCLYINFGDSTYSARFNPLSKCKTVSDIQKLAQIIIQNSVGESKSDPFWENSSIMLISLFGRYLVFHAPPELCTLQNLLLLIEKFAVDGKAVDQLILKTKDESLLATYKATLVTGEKTLQSIIATTRTALHLFNDPEVCKTTASNSFDFSILRKQQVAIFLCNPLNNLKYYRPLSALFFSCLFNYVLSTVPHKDERHIFFVIDEFASMRFPDISVVISNIRKYRAGMLLCMQDEMSLIAKYGPSEAHQIKTNCGCQVYLSGQPLHTCKELNQIMGKYSYQDEKGIHVRELMSVDEIRMSNEAIILINNQAPLRYKIRPYYKNIWLRKFALSNGCTIAKYESSDPPLIQFIM